MPSRSPATTERDPLARYVAAVVEPQPDLDVLFLAARAVKRRPHLLQRRLEHILGDSQELERVGARSSLHPNGFAKVVLHVADRWGIRLHVWSDERRPMATQNDPHDHRWDFASWLITGTLLDTPYQRAIGALYNRHDYRRARDGTAALSEDGRSEALCAGEAINRAAGTVYMRTGSDLHSAEPLNDDLVASLVLQGPRSRAPASVYLPPGAPSRYHEPRLTAHQLSELLFEVIEALRA